MNGRRIDLTATHPAEWLAALPVIVGYRLHHGTAITFIPIFAAAVIARLMKTNYLKICGVVSGAMTDPPALEFANGLAPVHAQSTAYAAVYPLTMFLRILFAQILVLVTL